VPDDLIYPEWQAAFRRAIAESDPRARRPQIEGAEALIKKRLQEIADDPDHDLERLAIAQAIVALHVLKRET
jgi:hypothetical protein